MKINNSFLFIDIFFFGSCSVCSRDFRSRKLVKSPEFLLPGLWEYFIQSLSSIGDFEEMSLLEKL